MTDPLGSKESRSADAKEEERILTSAAAALSSSLAGGDVAKAEALLDFIKGRLLLSGTTLPLEAAQACGGALALSTTPQVRVPGPPVRSSCLLGPLEGLGGPTRRGALFAPSPYRLLSQTIGLHHEPPARFSGARGRPNDS